MNSAEKKVPAIIGNPGSNLLEGTKTLPINVNKNFNASIGCNKGLIKSDRSRLCVEPDISLTPYFLYRTIITKEIALAKEVETIAKEIFFFFLLKTMYRFSID
jgi:hypothetical protein